MCRTRRPILLGSFPASSRVCVLDCCAAPGGKSFAAACRCRIAVRCIPAISTRIVSNSSRARRRAAGHLHSGDASAGCLAARARMAQRDGRRAGRCTLLRTRRYPLKKPDIRYHELPGGAFRPPCSVPFLRSRRNMSAPAACCLQHPHDPAPGKRGCGGGLPAHASDPSPPRTRRGQRVPASRRERWSRCFRAA